MNQREIKLVRGLGKTVAMLKRDGLSIGNRYFISEENLLFENTLKGFESVKDKFYETSKEEWDRYFNALSFRKNGINALKIIFGFEKIEPPKKLKENL